MTNDRDADLANRRRVVVKVRVVPRQSLRLRIVPERRQLAPKIERFVHPGRVRRDGRGDHDGGAVSARGRRRRRETRVSEKSNPTSRSRVRPMTSATCRPGAAGVGWSSAAVGSSFTPNSCSALCCNSTPATSRSALHQRVVGRDVRPERFRDERSKAIRHRGHRGVPAKRRVRGRDIGRDVIHGSAFDVFRGSVFDVIARRFSRRLGGDERGETRETPGEIRASRAEDPRAKAEWRRWTRTRTRFVRERAFAAMMAASAAIPRVGSSAPRPKLAARSAAPPDAIPRASPRAPRDGARRDAAATTKKGERFELGVRGGVRVVRRTRRARRPRRRARRPATGTVRREIPRRDFQRRFSAAAARGVTRGLSEKCRVAKRAGGVEHRGDVPTDAIARVERRPRTTRRPRERR